MTNPFARAPHLTTLCCLAGAVLFVLISTVALGGAITTVIVVISAATGAAGSAATSAVSDRALKKEQIMSKSLYVQLKQEREVVAMMRDAATPQDAIAHPKDSTD